MRLVRKEITGTCPVENGFIAISILFYIDLYEVVYLIGNSLIYLS